MVTIVSDIIIYKSVISIGVNSLICCREIEVVLLLGAKDDLIFISLAGKGAGSIIKCIAISPGTSSLKDARIE